jgi:hypothetical protein
MYHLFKASLGGVIIGSMHAVKYIAAQYRITTMLGFASI